MLGTHDLWAFLLASFLVWITPGQDTMYILARSVVQGRRGGVLSVFGIATGLLVHTLLAAFGLSALLAASVWAFVAIKVLGAGYLIYLGVLACLRGGRASPTGEVRPASAWRVYRDGVLSNALNPKTTVFFLAFLPQFVTPGPGAGPAAFLLLGTLFMVGGTLWCLLLAMSAARAATLLRRRPATVGWLERASGCVYIGLGLNLLRSRPHAV
jgi:threonine/homoserine/homoserine lactone efflux protein